MRKPREVLIFSEPGEHTLHMPSWVTDYKVYMEPANTHGENGYVIVELYDGIVVIESYF